MTIKVLEPPTDEDVKQAAESQMLFEARQKLEREYREAYESGQAQHAAVRQQRAAIEQDATAELAQIRELYQRRAKAAQALSKAVADFAQAESEIKAALKPIDQRLDQAWAGMWPDQRRQRLEAMRLAGGLLAQHGDIGAQGLDKLGATVCGGLINGLIAPGSIGSGRGAVSFD